MPPQVRRSWRKKIRQIVTTKIMQKNMVKNWTVALKLKLKLHLWSTLCLVKSLWFNKKKTYKKHFLIPRKFFLFHQNLPHKNLVEKKFIIPYPSLTTFLLVLTFSYYYYLLGPIFAHSISVFCCRVWIEYRCLSTRATAAPEVSWFWHRKCTPPSSLSMKRDYRKLELWKFSPTVHLFQSLSTIILNVSCCVLKIQILF